jgi:hypothetical protein
MLKLKLCRALCCAGLVGVHLMSDDDDDGIACDAVLVAAAVTRHAVSLLVPSTLILPRALQVFSWQLSDRFELQDFVMHNIADCKEPQCRVGECDDRGVAPGCSEVVDALLSACCIV